MLAETFDTPTLVTTGAILVVAMVLGYRLLNRNPNVRRTRWGLFVERDHFQEEDPVEDQHQVDPADAATRIDWPKREEP